MVNPNLIANTAGILSLVSSTAVLSPTFFNLFQRNLNRKQLILDISRFSLLLSISLGLIHGLLMTQTTNINFYNFNTYWIYGGGLFVFNFFVFFAFTFSELKRDFKKFNYFNCALLLLLLCHVGQKIIF